MDVTAEEIVRALASGPIPADHCCQNCTLCDPDAARDWFVELASNVRADHQPTCPWRLALEWVRSHS